MALTRWQRARNSGSVSGSLKGRVRQANKRGRLRFGDRPHRMKWGRAAAAARSPVRVSTSRPTLWLTKLIHQSISMRLEASSIEWILRAITA